MKMRRAKTEITDTEEHEAVAAVRRLAQDDFPEPSGPPPAYFANLMVKTNATIDRVTSGKALSISWLARVAVPGVVAILFFFIGLHYYGTENIMPRHSLTEAVRNLRAQDLDSLLVESTTSGNLTASDIPSDMFDVSNDQLAEFYLSSGTPAEVLEALPDGQVREVASILESRIINL
jgi:hypothetical protein